MEAPSPHRFVVLDGFRGIAAVAIVLYHAAVARGLPGLAGRAYLAVDFFFVLSGFVLAHAYEVRLRSRSLTPLAFYGIRFRRLWPMAFLGTAVGALLLGTKSTATLVAAGFGALMPPDIASVAAFPLNPPHWSIVLELAANYVYALVAPWLSRRALLITVAASAVWVSISTVRAGNANHIAPARVAFGFFAGVGIYRAWRAGVRADGPNAMLLAAGLLACLLTPAIPAIGAGVSDAATQLIAFPLIVWLGASATAGSGTARAYSLAGRASYPLYALHYPILMRLL